MLPPATMFDWSIAAWTVLSTVMLPMFPVASSEADVMLLSRVMSPMLRASMVPLNPPV